MYICIYIICIYIYIYVYVTCLYVYVIVYMYNTECILCIPNKVLIYGWKNLLEISWPNKKNITSPM